MYALRSILRSVFLGMSQGGFLVKLKNEHLVKEGRVHIHIEAVEGMECWQVNDSLAF